MSISKKLFLFLIISTVVFIPLASFAVDFGEGPAIRTEPRANNGDITFFLDLLGKVLDIIWIIFIAFAVIMFIIAGFQFLAAHGEVESVSKARKMVLWGIIGVIIAVMAFIIPFFIRNTISPPPAPLVPPGELGNPAAG